MVKNQPPKPTFNISFWPKWTQSSTVLHKLMTKAQFIYPSQSWKYDRILRMRSYSENINSILRFGIILLMYLSHDLSKWILKSGCSLLGPLLPRVQWVCMRPLLYNKSSQVSLTGSSQRISLVKLLMKFSEYDRIFKNTIVFSRIRSYFQEYDG